MHVDTHDSCRYSDTKIPYFEREGDFFLFPVGMKGKNGEFSDRSRDHVCVELLNSTMNHMDQIFTPSILSQLFPPERSNEFFEALFGDPEEGAYDISLSFQGYDREENQVRFHLDLHERPGCCLACNLTYGLPEVFSRHPVIDIPGLVRAIEKKLPQGLRCRDWKLGTTIQQSSSLHSIPLIISLA